MPLRWQLVGCFVAKPLRSSYQNALAGLIWSTDASSREEDLDQLQISWWNNLKRGKMVYEACMFPQVFFPWDILKSAPVFANRLIHCGSCLREGVPLADHGQASDIIILQYFLFEIFVASHSSASLPECAYFDTELLLSQVQSNREGRSEDKSPRCTWPFQAQIFLLNAGLVCISDGSLAKNIPYLAQLKESSTKSHTQGRPIFSGLLSVQAESTWN